MYIEIIKWNWNDEHLSGDVSVYFYEEKEEAVSAYNSDKEDLKLTDAEVFLCCEVINT